MATARQDAADSIFPLEGAIIRRYTAAGTIELGEIVSMASTGTISPADSTNMTLAVPLGIALQAAAAGDRLDVVVYGPCSCIKGGTAGGVVYVTNTAGEPGDAAGTKAEIIGVAESATVLFVRPQLSALS